MPEPAPAVATSATLAPIARKHGHRLVIDSTAPLNDLTTRFDADPGLPGALIHHNGRRIGLLSRSQVTWYLSRNFGRDVFVKRPIRSLLDICTTTACELDASTAIDQAVRIALSRPETARYEPIVITGDTEESLLAFESLMTAQCTVLSTALDTLARKHQELIASEDEKEKLSHQLVAVSRKAGMAEVATGVLHNVGNVLNSINVSTAFLTSRVRESRIPNVSRAASLLTDHTDNLTDFITRDPRGQQLPGYLEKLGRALIAEQDEMLRETQSLARSVEHIKKIIATQQTYARVTVVNETIDPADLFDDAIEMNRSSLNRHAIEITRRYDPIGPIVTDKHIVLQILVNLISNAKKAVRDRGSSDRHVTASLVAHGSGDSREVRFAVIDNGRGIATEDLTRIFQHGYTTDTDGNGVGLHNAANHAGQLGGSLIATSDGPGTGATFTLTIPAPAAGHQARAAA